MATSASPLPRPDALCEVRNIRHDFPLADGKPMRVLQDISLSIYPNEVVALPLQMPIKSAPSSMVKPVEAPARQ